jgi:thymidylate synthase
MRTFDMIMAVDSNWGLSAGGTLPWSDTPEGKEDLMVFRKITSKSTVIMGRCTYDSIPPKHKPLRCRQNIILSHNTHLYDNVLSQDLCKTVKNTVKTTITYVSSIQEAFTIAKYKIFIIGGKSVYTQLARSAYLRYIYWTQFDRNYHCDTTMDKDILRDGVVKTVEYGAGYSIYRTDFKNYNEKAYRDLITRATSSHLRNGTRGLFGVQLRYHLTDTRGMVLPLLTCRKIYWKKVLYELLWFLRGDTNIEYLTKHNVHIWDANTTPEYLASRKLPYAAGEVGPSYGFQWRNYGGKYTSGTNGVDQITQVIDQIKNNPYSRRHVVCAWNPQQNNMMALPPCHYTFQFDVRNGMLNCMVTMRSCDSVLGLPFNIASYSLLTHMIASICGLTAGELIMSIGDFHIYSKHDVTTLLTRPLYRPPLVKFVDIDFTLEGFINSNDNNYIVDEYVSGEPIYYPIVV